MSARLIVGSILLAASATLFAQAPAKPESGGEGHRGMRPCAQEPDPAKCEARRKEMREHFKAARDACSAKQGADHGPCMAQQMCAKAPDPAKCLSHAKERMEHRHEMHEKGGPKPAPKS